MLPVLPNTLNKHIIICVSPPRPIWKQWVKRLNDGNSIDFPPHHFLISGRDVDAPFP